MGGAFGFNTEVGPGISLPPVDGLRLGLGGEAWPIDKSWRYHAGPRLFDHLGRLNGVMKARYGAAKTIEDFEQKAQLLAYEGHRAMYEAFRRNKDRQATGIVVWMLNNAWHSLYWNLYDYDLRQGGAYYGVKKANRPQHLIYGYDDQSVVAVNSSLESHVLTAKVRVFSLDSIERFAVDISVEPPPPQWSSASPGTARCY
ncbi:MAG: hypothetical protein HN348_26640 [Proteobacteria bacterium]|nr:hypothetical protein [Pseudomonadota bacterium]